MVINIVVLVLYLAGLFLIGWWARTHVKDSAEKYFLAGRGLGPLIFLATMTATNFSAFTVLGCSGAGYRDGYAFYPIIGFGTGFMAITFWIIGKKAREFGLEKKALTPPGLIREAYGSKWVSTLSALVLIIFTIPYLALQPLGAGLALNKLLGLDQIWGAGIVTLVITLYTLRGGLRAVARTDALQGIIMLVVLIAALLIIAGQAGGLVAAGKTLLEQNPELFSRPGGQGKYTISIWFSFLFLWFFCDPMFPQLFQRFLAARDDQTIRRTMLVYPLICSIVFLLPVTIGVLGRLSHPDLTGKAADQILPILAASLDMPLLGALIVAAIVAALMSTMDSQLLTLSSMFSQDIYPLFVKKIKSNGIAARIFVILLALLGFGMAVNPPGTILSIASQTFTGLAVLFPTVLFALYPHFRSGNGAIASIVLGEIAVVLYFFKLLPGFGFLSIVPVMVIVFCVYLAVSLTERIFARQKIIWPMEFIRSKYTWAFLLIFLAAMDVWWWEKSLFLILGWPAWIFYFLVLSGLQTAVMYLWTKTRSET